MTSVLFVCLGNICRSPAAEGILKELAKDKELHVESCGMGDWHVGNLPDPRMREAAERRGLVLTSRAQEFKREFFDRFDYILAADREVLHGLYHYAEKPEHKARVHLMTAFSKSYRDQEVPDPYYGGDDGFEQVLDMLTDACEGLLENIVKKIQ